MTSSSSACGWHATWVCRSRAPAWNAWGVPFLIGVGSHYLFRLIRVSPCRLEPDIPQVTNAWTIGGDPSILTVRFAGVYLRLLFATKVFISFSWLCDTQL